MSFSPTTRRFWSMILCGFAAAALFGLMQPLFQSDFVDLILTRLGALGGTPLVACFVVASLIWAGKAGYGRRIGFLGTKNFFQFPPLWLAVGVALASLYAIDWLIYDFAVRNEMCASVSWWIWDDLCRFDTRAQATALVMAGLLIWFLLLAEQDWSAMSQKEKTPELDEAAEKPVDLNELAQDVDKLIAWFENDDPITDPKQDAFGHGRVAKRIADRLAKLATKEMDASQISTALIGPIGSGKTTIMRLVQKDLQSRPDVMGKVVVIDISLWPYTTAEAAVRGIIELITKELGKHINSLGLSKASRNYIRAVQSAGGWFGAFGHLLDGNDDPAGILEKLDEAANAIGLRIVVWIEDQERFITPVHADSTERAAALRKGMSQLAPMHALLYLIDQCKDIGIVWADVDTGVRFDRHKLTRYQEKVPGLSPNEVRKMIWPLRDSFMAGRYGRFIDSADEETRKVFRQPKGSIAEMVFSNLMDRDGMPLTAARAVTEVIQTPRMLKDVLRLFHDQWRLVWGDLDIDDLLVMSVFQSVRPELVDFCRREYETMSDGLERSSYAESRDTKSPARVIANADLDLILPPLEEPRKDPFRSLLNFVFPTSPSHWRHEALRKPQGVARGSEYWETFDHLERPKRAASDQEVLRAVRDFVNGDEEQLLELILDGEKGGRVSAFADPIPREHLPRLFETLMRRVISRSASLSSRDREAPISSFVGLIHQNQPESQEMVAVIIRIIDELLPDHWPLAFEMTSQFNGSGDTAVLEGKHRSAMNRHLCQRVIVVLKDSSPQTLIDALEQGDEFLLVWTFGASHVTPADRKEVSESEWEAFIDVVMSAARLSPEVVLPQVANVIISDRTPRQTERSRIVRERLSSWFGNHRDPLLELFRQTPTPKNLKGQGRSIYEDTRHDALHGEDTESPETGETGP